MATVTIYNNEGTESGKMELNPALFEVSVSDGLIHEAVTAQMSNRRHPIAHTKDRSDVRGSGQKPWKQKGTGRARHGSRRSPIWSGGGITFGPRNTRNFTKKLNIKARRKALAMVLSDKVAHDRMVVVESIVLSEAKTTDLVKRLDQLPLAGKKTLVIVGVENKTISQAAGNLSHVSVIPSNCLNVVDLLRAEYILTDKEALEQIQSRYAR